MDHKSKNPIYRLSLCQERNTVYTEKNIELEVLQRHTAKLTSAIETNPSLFGQHLVQCELAVLSTVTGVVNTLGVSDYQKGAKLLSLVDNKIRTAESKESARKYFDDVLKIFAEHMGNRDIVESLVATYSKFMVLTV